MSMDCKGNGSFKSKNVLSSFVYAMEGIQTAVRGERNLKIHFFIGAIVIIFGFILGLSHTEWLFVLFAIGGVLCLELINSAIERIVDLVTEDYHPLAKHAKDMAAGAVLIYVIFSVITGIIIFLPKILRYF